MIGNMCLFDLKKRLGEDCYRDLYVRHGSSADRGASDSYYRRGYRPHYYTGATYSSTRIEEHEMTKEQIEAYAAGYDENELNGDFKDWG